MKFFKPGFFKNNIYLEIPKFRVSKLDIANFEVSKLEISLISNPLYKSVKTFFKSYPKMTKFKFQIHFLQIILILFNRIFFK